MYNRLSIRFEEKLKFYPFKKGNEILEIGEKTSFSTRALKFIAEFEEIYCKNKNKKENGFFINEKKVDFEQLFQQLLPYQNEISIWMHVDPIYEEEDFDMADAFLMNFPKYCYYYDEPEDERYNSMQVLYKGKEDLYREHIEKMYIAPNGLKSKFAKECTGASTDLGIHIISQEMKEYLLDNGISEAYIKPVYQKNGQRWADYLFGEEHMLPSFSVLGYTDDVVEPYQKYRVIEIDHKMKRGDSLWNSFTEAVQTGIYPCIPKYEIRADVLDTLGDVNITTDFYGWCRCTVISKRLFELIRKQVPKITTVSQPIFAADFDVEIGEHGEIIKKYK